MRYDGLQFGVVCDVKCGDVRNGVWCSVVWCNEREGGREGG